jgi:DNA repair protein SbcD/Mre11
MTKRLRLVHCSDIHLDADASHHTDGHYHRDRFARALDQMRAQEPDLMLIAGDLFDSNRADDDTVLWSMDILAAQPVPIFMIPGNHDCMLAGGIFGRHDFGAIDNLHMLSAPDGETAWDESLGVAVWGKGMEEHTPEYRPLGDCPARPDGCHWYLGMGHGHFVPEGEDTDRSSPIPMRDIETSPCDYVALGHHHAAMELVTDSTIAAYSGSPTDDIGRGATFAVAELYSDKESVLEIKTIA